MAVNSLRSLKASAFDYWQAHHLLNRAGFGGTPSQVRALTNLGLEKAVDYVVNYDRQPYPTARADSFDRHIMTPPTQEQQQAMRQARRTGDELALERYQNERQERERADRRQMQDIQKWWLTRLIETPRPLEEKMTLFWHGHFATGYRTIEDSYHMFVQNELFRRMAVGNFRELTHAIVRDPAMIRYLDNNQNRRQAPNENLARELMELFTLGEGHDYTETDIKEAARALTGFTYDDDEFIFRRQMHDDGPKQILGRTGAFDGADLVDIIFSRDIASEFITWKLYRFFVNDLPGTPGENAQGFILKLARLLREERYELKPVLRTLFMSEHFYDEANVASQIKSPVQLIVQAVRSLRTPVRQLGVLLGAADLMGQNIFFPPSVKGWDGGRSWINTSTLFVRQNILVYLLTGKLPQVESGSSSDPAVYDPMHLVDHLDLAGGGGAAIHDAAAYLLRFNLGKDPHPDRVQQLVEFAGTNGGTLDDQMLIAMLCLITSMPEYQLC
jgi:uncharacterized protein (DUF1800 family)